MRSKFFVVSTLFIILSSTNPIAALSFDAKNPSRIVEQIRNRGASAVVKELWDDQSTWNLIITNISSGLSDWVDVSLALNAGADAGASGMLHDALFQALGKNPEYTLKRAEENYQISELCGGRHDPLASFDQAMGEHEAIITRVNEVKTDQLLRPKKECLSYLEEGKINLFRFFGRMK
jgi:hypothetical protein